MKPTLPIIILFILIIGMLLPVVSASKPIDSPDAKLKDTVNIIESIKDPKKDNKPDKVIDSSNITITKNKNKGLIIEGKGEHPKQIIVSISKDIITLQAFEWVLYTDDFGKVTKELVIVTTDKDGNYIITVHLSSVCIGCYTGTFSVISTLLQPVIDTNGSNYVDVTFPAGARPLLVNKTISNDFGTNNDSTLFCNGKCNSWFTDVIVDTQPFYVTNATTNNLFINLTNNNTVRIWYGNASRTVSLGNMVNTVGSDNVIIGNQVWAKYNLNIGTRIDGNVEMTDNGIIEKYCYNNNEANCTTDGGLYQWNETMNYSTVEGSQGIAPAGFHIPSDVEWHTLENYLKDGSNTCNSARTGWDCDTAGTKLKTSESSGFAGMLSGNRVGGTFFNIGIYGGFWTSTENDTISSQSRYIGAAFSTIYRGADSKNYGNPVRPIMNTTIVSMTPTAEQVSNSTATISLTQTFNAANVSTITIQNASNITGYWQAKTNSNSSYSVNITNGTSIPFGSSDTAITSIFAQLYYYTSPVNITATVGYTENTTTLQQSCTSTVCTTNISILHTNNGTGSITHLKLNTGLQGTPTLITNNVNATLSQNLNYYSISEGAINNTVTYLYNITQLNSMLSTSIRSHTQIPRIYRRN